MEQKIGQGGFFFPTVYREDRNEVEKLLSQGLVDLLESSHVTLADQFMAFILAHDFLPFADRTYPTPREKTEIPIWFLITCQLLLRLQREKGYQALSTLLKSGPILSQVGFNVGTPVGFNDKNRHPRQTPVHPDSVRKFFKDTDPQAMRRWFRIDLQQWFGTLGRFDAAGIFLLDQTHLVVPDNPHYQDAVRMPVDEHGQRYPGLNQMTPEQKRTLPYHPCYTLSNLVHLSTQDRAFHVAGYEFGPGNEDELPQARQLIQAYFEGHKPRSMKLLIADRGYISGDFITWIKQTYQVDVLIPLKSDMQQYRDALVLCDFPETQWVSLQALALDTKKTRYLRACFIDEIKLWDECKVPLYTTVVEIEKTHSDPPGVSRTKFCLCSTKKFDHPHQVIAAYRLRSNIEECFRQLKIAWDINQFPSPARSLLEAHIGFTLLTYSLLQCFLRKENWQNNIRRLLKTLHREELNNHQSILVYAREFFAAFGAKEFTLLINNLSPEVREKLTQSLEDSPNSD